MKVTRYSLLTLGLALLLGAAPWHVAQGHPASQEKEPRTVASLELEGDLKSVNSEDDFLLITGANGEEQLVHFDANTEIAGDFENVEGLVSETGATLRIQYRAEGDKAIAEHIEMRTAAGQAGHNEAADNEDEGFVSELENAGQTAAEGAREAGEAVYEGAEETAESVGLNEEQDRQPGEESGQEVADAAKAAGRAVVEGAREAGEAVYEGGEETAESLGLNEEQDRQAGREQSDANRSAEVVTGLQLEGELKAVDSEKRFLLVTDETGVERLVYFDEQTEVAGSGTVQGLSTESGTMLHIDYRAEGEKAIAESIEMIGGVSEGQPRDDGAGADSAR